MPPSSDEVKYMEALLSICSTESVDVVLPITTRELDVLAKHAETIKSLGIQLILSSADALITANNKGLLA